ncbi:hypothetical protein TEA_011768 [Camellia sinensis var. sinensis]|uniref:Uncharacterized protein n=1 Tax=Camellia sinensis var. sinensis TaxID=542762 RepID=A0A4S4EK12_CAMSN|nr:hypothetical protein TEA_011768 [Camellia sinensis var. sinensis]
MSVSSHFLNCLCDLIDCHKFSDLGISTSETASKEWYQIQAVLRVSLGNFLFFAILALVMIGVKDQNDKRDSWHHGGWTAKLVIWALLTVLMFFMPNEVITIYGILFIWFDPSGQDCGLNVFFLVMTMILAFAFAVIALHPQVNGSLLPASVISVYCAYVCYTGLSSEPRYYVCNGLHNKSAVTTSTLLLGMLTTVLSVLYSAVRAGSSTTFLSPPSSPKSGGKKPLLDSEVEEESSDNLMRQSRGHSNESSELIDVGWTSVWVRIVSEWVTAVLYVWTLIAPLILSDREFN